MNIQLFRCQEGSVGSSTSQGLGFAFHGPRQDPHQALRMSPCPHLRAADSHVPCYAAAGTSGLGNNQP